MVHPKRLLFFLSFVWACGTDPEDKEPTDSSEPDSGTEDTDSEGLPAPEGDPATVPLEGACPMASDLGGFVVEIDLDYSIVDGSVLDAVVPTSVLTEEAAVGDCQLLRRENPFCDPVCESGFTCSLEGECVPFPSEQNLGNVTVAGLVADVIMEPREPGARYYDTTLPHPAVDPGTLVELRTAPDGVLGELVLHGVGPEPLESLDEELVVVAGRPLSVSWTPAAADVRTHVEFFLNIDQHGSSPLRISCLFPDTGSGEVDAALIQGLVAGGVTGFPSARLRRQTVDHALTDDGCMDFGVASPRFVGVQVDGFTPCTDDDDCPDGQTCNRALEICE